MCIYIDSGWNEIMTINHMHVAYIAYNNNILY